MDPLARPLYELGLDSITCYLATTRQVQRRPLMPYALTLGLSVDIFVLSMYILNAEGPSTVRNPLTCFSLNPISMYILVFCNALDGHLLEKVVFESLCASFPCYV